MHNPEVPQETPLPSVNRNTIQETHNNATKEAISAITMQKLLQ